ncbi:uncharacterized protein PV09_06306 [Verruconis gallopava]|uniref:Uncharacterized protein n=1 Tax=Verruconis gallopava TaxID=253628 RepID=A0A0D1XJP1_9PEZI|nr:uncharacterized protein PV09_06306 [Verruconis gallopava]KIW02506.1 hypothetical protein PV09_06306 [Verruconis gallopava]
MTIWVDDIPYAESRLRDLSRALPRVIGTTEEEVLTKNFNLIIDRLIDTALDLSISSGHRSAAINTICSVVGCSKLLPESPSVSQNAWFRCLSILLDRSDRTKSRPLRQLLICLTDALNDFPNDEKDLIVDLTTDDVLQILLQQSDHVKAKPALHILTNLLSKDILGIKNLIEHCRKVRNSSCPDVAPSPSDIVELQWVLQIIFGWVRSGDTSIAAGQAGRTLVKSILKCRDIEIPASNPLWVLPLIRVLKENVDDLHNFRSHLLPELFKSQISHYRHFLTALGLDRVLGPRNELGVSDIDATDARILFTCLEVGKEAGIVIDSAVHEVQIHNDMVHIPETALAKILEHDSCNLRLSGLALVISSATVTRPFTGSTLRCLERNFSHLFMETDLYVRGEVLVYVQRLVDRIKAATAALTRIVSKRKSECDDRVLAATGQVHDDNPEIALMVHRQFLRSFIILAKAQLHPAAAYQRHISGLRTLIILAKSGLDGRLPQDRLSKQAQSKEATKWAFHETIFDSLLSRLLQDLLMDPFEDVRSFASSLLAMQACIPQLAFGAMQSRLLRRAEQLMLSTGRADHADGVSRANALIFEAATHADCTSDELVGSKEAHMAGLLERLEERITLAQNDLKLAVGKFPLHGVLASIRLVLDNSKLYDKLNTSVHTVWQSYHGRLVKALGEVWNSVKDVLCNDAPEGYVPEDMEEDISIGTKDILSYCWRALKEASSLLRALVSRASVGDREDCLLTPVQFETLSRLAFTELVELRHRGAFSAVSQSFAACCSRANTLKRYDLLEKLFVDTLNAIQAKGSATTRRSAGLPSLVVGIFGACPTSDLFRQGMNDLIAEAKLAPKGKVLHGDSLPQVHALNSIRAIFINTVLGQYTEPYIATALDLAGRCLTSDIWAIRNCGLMLFRALIDRLLGSADSQNWSEDTIATAKPRSSYNEFPRLLEMTLDLLKPASTSLESTRSSLESVFPALKLMQRMPPPTSTRGRVRELVLRLCQSPHWHVRDMAARTYAVLLPITERCMIATTLIPELETPQNVAHGQLLCISYAVKLEIQSSQPDYDAMRGLEQMLNREMSYLMKEDRSPFCRTVYLDILNMIGLHRLKNQIDIGLSDHHTISMNEIEQVFAEAPTIRRSLALHVLLRYIFSSQELGEGDLNPSHQATVSLSNYLDLLEVIDARVTLQVLESVIDMAQNIPNSSLEVVAKHLCCAASKGELQDPHVLGTSRMLLVRLYETLGRTENFFYDSLRSEDMKWTICNATSMPPSLLENTVLLWGPLLNKACMVNANDAELLEDLDTLAMALRPLIDEHQSIDLRLAVVRCLASIQNLWKPDLSIEHKSYMERIRLKFILLIYDLLNDDDEGIRSIATTICSAILSEGKLSGQTTNAVPLLASRKLIAHIRMKYSHMPEVFDQAVLRMKGFRTQSCANVFADVIAENTALFAVEKQNLFLDPIREANHWSQLLKCIPEIKHVPQVHVRSFFEWTKEGLDLLQAYIEHNMDGVLGWTSKPNMFVFGMQVWCAVDVVLVWKRRFQLELDVVTKLTDRLAHVLTLSKKQEVHPLWLEKLEKMLSREVESRIQNGAAFANLRSAMAALPPMQTMAD